MPVPDHLKGRSRAFLDRYGREATVHTYTFDASGGYAAADESRAERANSSYTANVLVEDAGDDAAHDEGHTRLDGTHTVLLPDDVVFRDELTGAGEDDPPSTVEAGGREYRVVSVFDEDSGLLALDAEVITP